MCLAIPAEIIEIEGEMATVKVGEAMRKASLMLLSEEGKIGDYVTIARKKNNAWYIGSITDENPRELLVKLDFLDEKVMYEAVVYADGPDADWVSNPLDYVIEKRMVKKDEEYVIRLAPGGGQAITVTPVN
mgnify:CR=1 FL=1